MTRAVRAGRRAMPAGLALLGTACSGSFGMSRGATEQGADIFRLWQIFFIAAIPVAGVVYGLIFWSVIRYRRRRSEDPGALGSQFRGNHRIELVYMGIPILIVIGGVILYASLNRIVRATVEKQSTSSLNVPTSLGSANVSLFGGKVSLNDFQVGSPQGFQAPHLMTLGGIDVKASLGELRNDPVRVATIAIKDPKLVIEMQGTNFNVKKFIDALPAGEDKPTPEGQKPLKLIIGDLNVSGAQVVFRPDVAALSALPGLDKAGLKQEYVLSIPPLDMQNIGTGEGNQNGAAIKEIVSLLVTQLAAKATQSDQLPPELRQVLSLNIDQMVESVKAKVGEELNKQLGKITGDISKKVPGEAGQAIEGMLKNSDLGKEPGKAIEQGLGGLLGGKDQKKKATPTTR